MVGERLQFFLYSVVHKQSKQLQKLAEKAELSGGYNIAWQGMVVEW